MSPFRLLITFAIITFAASLAFQFKPSRSSSKVKSQFPISDGSFQTANPTAAPDVQVQQPIKPDRTKSVFFDVPFTSQAPFSEWSDPHFQDACEEASALMAMKWVNNEKISSKIEAKNEILAISTWETENFGNYHDTSAKDTVSRIFNGYFHFGNAFVRENVSANDIIMELQKGNLVIAPMNGQILKNPFFTQPGPQRHMILVKGFDAEKQEFITNDPGVSQGDGFRYPIDVFVNSIRDYPTGDHQPITGIDKNIIIVKNNKP